MVETAEVSPVTEAVPLSDEFEALSSWSEPAADDYRSGVDDAADDDGGGFKGACAACVGGGWSSEVAD